MYTLVQHTGLNNAVELAYVTPAVADKIAERGGLTFTTYDEASDAEVQHNYPDPAYQGLYPRCTGTFGGMKVDGQRIYIPRLP
jgi:hypothetical protein